MDMRMIRISTGSKSPRRALVDTNVTPQTMAENRAAMCPVHTEPSMRPGCPAGIWMFTGPFSDTAGPEGTVK